MNELELLLSSLGLEHQEAKVYLAALTLGTSPASNIAKRTDMPRSTARYTCEQLSRKQLMIESQKGNTKLFTPENPEKLKKLLDLQVEEIETRGQRLDSSLQDLKRLYNPYTVLPKVRFYEGADGIMEMFEEFLEENTPFCGVTGGTGEVHPRIVKYLAERYVPKRQELKNPTWMLLNDSDRLESYRKNDASVNRISLVAPEKAFPFKSCCHIYGNKVAFYSYFVQDMTGVIIENAIIHETQLSLFRLAWSAARALPINKIHKDVELPL